MLKPNFAIYIGEEKEDGFSGFICQNELFCLLKIEEGLNKEEGRVVLKKLADGLEYANLKSLGEFEAYLADNWKTNNLPAGLSFAAVFLTSDLAWLKTATSGEIYLKRAGQMAKLIEGDN